MADEFLIDIPDLSVLTHDLTYFERDALKELKSGMTDFSLLVETGSRALAQRFHGDLEQSINAAAVAITNGMVVGSVGSNLAYAWIRHEQPYRPGTHDLYDQGVRFPKYYLNGRGRRTHLKQRWRGMVPGRKYMERVVTAVEPDFENLMSEAIARALRNLERGAP